MRRRTSAAVDAWMNSRRLRYTLFGVISEERISGAFLISMPTLYAAPPVGDRDGDSGTSRRRLDSESRMR